MVRRKDDGESRPSRKPESLRRGRAVAARPVKVEKKTVKVQPVESFDEAVPAKKTTRQIGKKNVWRPAVLTVLVLMLLGLGWFAARAAISGLDGLRDGSGLAGLFGSQSKLVGEEEGRVNILLMGNPGDPKHDGPYLTDTLMVASYNTKDKHLHLISIPRDLYVTPDGYKPTKINAVYELGESNEDNGPGTITKTVEKLFGMEIPYYVRIDFEGFKKVVDSLGGVTVEVKKDLYDPQYPDTNNGYQLLDIKAGTYTMDGEMALKYVRSRHTTSDFDRARRQQEVLVALRNKAKDIELLTAPSKVFEIGDILASHYESNLEKKEAERALTMISEFDASKITNVVLDDSSSGVLYGTKTAEGMFVLKPVGDDYNKIKEYVQASIATLSGQQPAPSNEQESTEPLKIEVLNGTAITGLAGKIATKLKPLGFTIVRTGNNATKGIKESVIYDGTDGKRITALRKLAEASGATISSEKITLPAGVEARLVVGENANSTQ